MLLIRFLIISICILYILRAVVRIFLPMLFQGFVNKAQQQQQNTQQRQYSQQKRPTGAIKVDFMPPAQKGAIPDSEGEFVDYEEVK
jgi:flagellar basal body-associated protein FliL